MPLCFCPGLQVPPTSSSGCSTRGCFVMHGRVPVLLCRHAVRHKWPSFRWYAFAFDYTVLHLVAVCVINPKLPSLPQGRNLLQSTVLFRLPFTGSAVNITPEACAKPSVEPAPPFPLHAGHCRLKTVNNSTFAINEANICAHAPALLAACDVGVAVLLARKAQVGKVFRRGTGTTAHAC